MAKNTDKGVSLAKGPVAIVGMLLLAAGVLGFIFAGRDFAIDFPDGTQNGKSFLGFEANGWTNLLMVAAGALLLFGSPLHWAAKSLSLIVGLVLGAVSVIALVDADDALGIFAANGPTKLLLGATAAVLIVLALLPRVGGGKQNGDREPARRSRREPEPQPEVRRPRAEPQVQRDAPVREDPSGTGSRVVAPASETRASVRQRGNGSDPRGE